MKKTKKVIQNNLVTYKSVIEKKRRFHIYLLFILITLYNLD